MLSEAQKRARNNWDARNMTVITCKLKREIAEEFKLAAKADGKTPNELFRSWISEYINTRSEIGRK